MALGVVVEQVGEHLITVIHQIDITRELCLLGVQLVTSVLRPQLGIVAVINDGTAVEVVAHVGINLIVQRIGQQRGAAVLEAHVATQFCHALVAIVVQDIAIDPQRVALRHPHMSEGVQRTGLGIKIGAVTEHVHIATAKTYIALQHLIVAADYLIRLQDIGILKKHLVGLIAAGFGNLGGNARHIMPF